MAPRAPLDDHTEPAFDDEPESATESIARELLTQLAKSRMAASSVGDAFHEPSDGGATRTDAPYPAAPPGVGDDPTRPVKPISLEPALEPAIDAHDQATRLVTPMDAPLSLSMGDLTSDGLKRLHLDHAFDAIDAVDEDERDTNDFDVVTSPGLMPAPKTGADAMKEKRGDIAQLLASIAPFLWSLEAAEKWVRDHAHGDPDGEAHARSLALLARILGQLQARIDEATKQVR